MGGNAWSRFADSANGKFRSALGMTGGQRAVCLCVGVVASQKKGTVARGGVGVGVEIRVLDM